MATPEDVASLSIPDIWHPEIMQCLNDKFLTDSLCNEMSRCLSNLLFSFTRKPRKLIIKYPFMKDELGNGIDKSQ